MKQLQHGEGKKTGGWRFCFRSSSVLCSVILRSGPSRLMGHSAVTYRDTMLLFGGAESQNSPKNLLWSFSFTTQTWWQVATVPGSNAPNRIHHCCIGLGPSYSSSTGSSSNGSGAADIKPRPFKNKCFPAPLTFLGSEAIELETFSPAKSCGSSKDCLTFENQQNCTEEEQLSEDDEDITQHLPDLLLVLGGRPCTGLSPISLWHMTLSDT